MSRAAAIALLLSTLAGCRGGAPPARPAGQGAGLLHADVEPPPGATLYQRPQWQVGDCFTLGRGGIVRAEFVVDSADATGYFVRSSGGGRLRRDLDLGNVGEWPAAGDDPQHLLSPADVRYHWPLWVGKRWQCEFVDATPGGPVLTTRADYVVEDLDTVTVPAGTFAALRILRTVWLVGGEDRVLWRTQVIWYAPALGTEVRQILADTKVELLDHRRAGA
jgi:hypothetical protein